MTRLLLTLFLISFGSSSCSLPMEKMRHVFDDWVQETLGRNIDELKYSETQAFIGKRVPYETKIKENGNLLYVYDYWEGTSAKRDGRCEVSLEFNPETMVVVRASSIGKGCYTAY